MRINQLVLIFIADKDIQNTLKCYLIPCPQWESYKASKMDRLRIIDSELMHLNVL